MKIVIIGNGVAGNTAASTIRKADPEARITLVSSENQVHYSPCALPHYIAGKADRETIFLKNSADYDRESIKAILGQTVTGISPEEKRIHLDTGVLPYDKLILATGSRPIMPPIDGIGLDGVFPLKSISDADNILGKTIASAAVVGSGPVGVETAIALHGKGIKVYVIELLDTTLSKIFDPIPSMRLRHIIEENGIEVFTGEKVTGIVGKEKVQGIITDKRRLRVDLVVMAAGMRPNVELAREAGIKIGKLGGIEVSTGMMTNLKDIFACGDCAEAYDLVTGSRTLSMLWHNAIKQAEVAGNNCCGRPSVYPGSMNITSIDIFGTHAVSMGACGAQLEQLKRIDTVEEAGADYYNRLTFSRQRLVGAQVIGKTFGVGAFLYAIMRKEKIRNSEEYSSFSAPHSLKDRLLVRHTDAGVCGVSPSMV